MAETVDLRPAQLDILATQGKTFVLTLVYDAIDISAYTADFRVRSSVGAGATDVLSGGITITFSTDSTVTVTKSASDMAAVAPGPYPWEIEFASGGVKDPALAIQGTLTVYAEYTV